MSSWHEGPLEISLRPTGVVRVGVLTAAPAGRGAVPISGGQAWVDPAAPESPPVIEIADADRGVAVVADLYGDEVADACLALSAEQTPAIDGPYPMVTAVGRSATLLDQVHRVGTLDWLGRQAPWSLDTGLLRLETMVERAECPVVEFDGPRLVDLVDDLLLALAGRPERSGVSLLLRRALTLAAPQLHAGDARHTAIDIALADAGAITPRALGLDLDRLIALCTPVGALHAGDTDYYVGSTAADWFRTPAGVLGRDEDTVSWHAELGPDGGVMEVSAAAARPAGTDHCPPLREIAQVPERLAVSLHVPSWPLALAVAALTPTLGGNWRGTLRLEQAASEMLLDAVRRGAHIVVDVHDPVLRSVTRPDPMAAEALRWAARGVASARVAAADERAVGAAKQALTRAARLWQVAGHDPSTEGGPKALACRALLDLLDNDPIVMGTATLTELEGVSDR